MPIPSKAIPAYLRRVRRLYPVYVIKRHYGAAAQPDEARSAGEIPESADTVVVGGGIVGTSVAYHLAKQSSQKVVLLEKTELTAGSTWHAAGLITLYHPGINIKRLHWHSMNFYNVLERETGQQVGFHQPGSLRIATTSTRVDEMNYQMARQGWNSAPQMMVTSKQAKELCPVINTDKVLAGLYSPYDGHIDPYSLTQAIAKGARKHGAQIFQKREVTGMEIQPDGTWIVNLPDRFIKANRVVNCTGFWAKEVGGMCGMNLPLVPMEHQYVITKSVPEIQKLDKEIPVLRDLEGSYYLRQERDGILVGPYETGCQAREDWARDGVPLGFGKELYPPDLDRLQSHLEAAMETVPCFATAEIQSIVNGPITYSPDILPMAGPSLMPNMWLAVGFAYGIVHGGGVGKYLADWIINGEPDYDLIEVDPLRYGKWATEEYAITKCKESYAMNNAMGFPNEDRLGGRPTYRTSGIHDKLVSAGAFMGFHSGWEQPDWYAAKGDKPEYKPSFYRTNIHEAMQREYEIVTKNVGVADITPFAKFVVKGDQSRKYLEHLVAGTVPKPGRTTLSHALTDGGKVMAEFTITGLDDGSFMVVTGSGSELHDLRHMKQVAFEENWDVEIDNATDKFGVLTVTGPNSRKVLSKCLQKDVDDWKFLDAKQCWISGVECLAIRISYTGELGWEIYIAIDKMEEVYESIMKNGSDLDIGHFGASVINVLRLEKGFKMWGNEMNLDCTILEAGLGQFVQWKRKSGFKGKEGLIREKGKFQEKALLMLEMDTEGARAEPEGNLSVWLCDRVTLLHLHPTHESTVVGNVTSACHSLATGKGLAFAYLPAYLDTKGIEVEVEMMGERYQARVLDKPPVLTEPMRNKEAGKL